MAKIISRTWTSAGPNGRKVRHTAYGYTLMGPKGRERKYSGEWTTETEALAALTARLQAIEAGRVDRPAVRTLSQVVEEYLRYKGDHGKRSLADDRRILETRLVPAFGADLPVRRLTAAAIARYEQRRVAEVSASTVHNELSVLRHVLRLARRWGYLEAVPDLALPKKPEGRLRYLEKDEMDRLLAACRESRNPYLLTIVVLAIHTGMRRGEILGLEWERVDLAAARMTLLQTKSGRPRGVPINQDVYDALIALEPDSAHRRTGRLFPPQRGAGRRGSQIRVAFERALERAKITDFRFHDLRHTAASHLIMRGASLADVKEILGHSTMAMTLRYAHLSPAHLRSAVERLEGLTPSRRPADNVSQAAEETSPVPVSPISD
jgi:integrase